MGTLCRKNRVKICDFFLIVSRLRDSVEAEEEAWRKLPARVIPWKQLCPIFQGRDADRLQVPAVCLQLTGPQLTLSHF